jgi:hypothetical protein
VDDLALQIAGVDDVEVDQAESADAGRGEIERQRRAQAAGADAEHARGFEAALALHAHFGQDEVARVAGEVVGGEFGQGGGFGDGGDDGERVGGGDGGASFSGR